MTASETMAELNRLGARMWRENDRLMVSPRAVVTPDLAVAIAENRDDILAAIATDPAGEVDSKPQALTEDQVDSAHRDMMRHGTVPPWYVLPGDCQHCGNVWLPDWAAPKVRACPWCSVRVPFARPEKGGNI